MLVACLRLYLRVYDFNYPEYALFWVIKVVNIGPASMRFPGDRFLRGAD